MKLNKVVPDISPYKSMLYIQWVAGFFDQVGTNDYYELCSVPIVHAISVM
ncbi:MAG: hypothetical protein KUG55_07850 [Cycloclasticus sp.]|nr:hypothetical protein [Cycloclasticus sp.]MEE4290502.1 hypothetical protein [Cycloclasticus sp.]